MSNSNLLLFVVRKYLKSRNRALVATMPQLGRNRIIDVFENAETNDYIRLSTLELCAHEIISKRIEGSVGEVGVYRGRFAAKLNQLFPDKKLYLFDTFEGFDSAQEKKDEKDHGLMHRRDFSDTSIQLVLSRMLSPSNCIIKKGLFPDSAAGIEEKFCLVSLDADLYQPTYDGLEWFWPRMIKGGYILVHDFNNSNFPGAKSAVNNFSSKNGVAYVPVTDVYGTAIFAK